MITAATIAQTLHLDRTGHCFTGMCPSCGYRGFTVEEREGKVLVHCHAGKCDQTEVLAALRDRRLWSEGKPRQETRTTVTDLTGMALKLWQRTSPAPGTPVETYLRARGYHGLIPPALRFLEKGIHKESGQTLPMMVAGVAWVDRPQLVAVHRTFLAPDGSGKAGVTPDKKSLGPVAGGAIWLSPFAETLCVAEGIETALSCLQATGMPSAAALSAGGMEQLLLPSLPLAAEVVIAADNDPRGLKAAETAARRWHREGRRVRIAVPPAPGTDFNDLGRREGGL